jgi:hypothetical protein
VAGAGNHAGVDRDGAGVGHGARVGHGAGTGHGARVGPHMRQACGTGIRTLVPIQTSGR